MQLIGTACIKIADQLCERSKEYYRQDNSSDYAYITANEFTPEQVVLMEKQILNTVDFRIIEPTVITELRHLADSKVAEYLADLTLMQIDIRVNYPPLMVAQACLLVAEVALGRPPRRLAVLHGRHFEKCCNDVRSMWMEFDSPGSHVSRFMAITSKYNELPGCPSYIPPEYYLQII